MAVARSPAPRTPRIGSPLRRREKLQGFARQAPDGRREDAPKEVEAKSLGLHGPRESLGSFGHPNSCKPCSFYCFCHSGCRLDRDCHFCHLSHESKRQKRQEEWKRKRPARPRRRAAERAPELPPHTGNFRPPPGLPPPSMEPPTCTTSALEESIQQVSRDTALVTSMLSVLSIAPTAQQLTSLAVVPAGCASSSTTPLPAMPPMPPMPQARGLSPQWLNAWISLAESTLRGSV